MKDNFSKANNSFIICFPFNSWMQKIEASDEIGKRKYGIQIATRLQKNLLGLFNIRIAFLLQLTH